MDDFSNRCCQGSFPLLKSINRGLGLLSDTGPTHSDCTKPPEPVTPSPPTLTTGVDTGASSSTEPWNENHDHYHPTTKPTSSTPWWTPDKTTTGSTTTTSKYTTKPWWTSRPTTDKPEHSTPWWVPSTPKPTTEATTTEKTTTTRTTTTTKKTTTPPWWQPEGTTIPPPAVIMPEIEHDEEQKKCEVGQYKPDPYNCNAYYRCVLGELKKHYCAGGLHWNKESSNCDWPEQAKCEQKGTFNYYSQLLCLLISY